MSHATRIEQFKENWQPSDKNIRAMQLAFEFNQDVSQTIRNAANAKGISPSDQIRTVIGLEPKKPKRPRLTVSLSEQDYVQLSTRYGLAPEDKESIRKAIAQELIEYSKSLIHGELSSSEV